MTKWSPRSLVTLRLPSIVPEKRRDTRGRALNNPAGYHRGPDPAAVRVQADRDGRKRERRLPDAATLQTWRDFAERHPDEKRRAHYAAKLAALKGGAA